MTKMKPRPTLRTNAPLFVLGALLTVSLLTRCSGSSQTSPGSPDAGGGRGGSGGGITTSGTGGTATLPCTPASVAQDCPLPASTCEGNGLVYYSNPTCVSGQCQWDHTTQGCYGPCVNGACSSSTTTTAPPPPDTGGNGGGGNGGSGGNGGVTSYANCGGAGGEAGAPDATCELPSSVCADSSTLLYFSNPRCVQGTCQADVNALVCGPSGCSNGGCMPSPTLK
jgi:hypothetical protein